MPDELKLQAESSSFTRFVWIPVPLFLIAIVVLTFLNPQAEHESETLLALCNFLFSTVASILVAILFGQSYVLRREPGLLMLGCGVLIWGSAGTLVPVLLPSGINVTISVHNSLVCVSAVCHLAGVVLLNNPRREISRGGPALATAYACSLGTVLLITMLAIKGRMPIFFIDGQGGTLLRSFVLGSAAAMFVLTSSVLLLRLGWSASSFVRWYGMALFLIALGLFGIMIEKVHGGFLSWTGRAAQFLGGAYMVFAAIAALRESGGRIELGAAKWDARLVRVLTPQWFMGLPVWWRYTVAIGISVATVALRVVLIPWLGTFYPYNIMYVSAAVSTVLLGIGPGLLCLFLGIAGVEIFVMQSLPSFFMAETLTRSGITLFVGIAIAFLLHATRVAAVRARKDAERLATFAEATFEGIVESQAGRIMDCNEQFLQMTGYKLEELRGMAIADLIAPEDRDRVLANFQPNLESVVENVMLRRDGTRIIVEAYGRPLEPGSNSRLTVIRDITERKQFEIELRESEDKFKYVFDNSPVGKSITSLSGEISVNRAMCEMLGYLPEELKDKKWQEITHPDDINLTSEALNSVASGEKNSVRLEKRYIHKNGSIVWGDLSTSVRRDKEGKAIYFMSVVVDITKRRQAEAELQRHRDHLEELVMERTSALHESEERYRMVVTDQSELINRFKPDGVLTFVNDAFCRFFGKSEAELIGQKWQPVAVIEDVPEIEAKLQTLSAKNPMVMIENLVYSANGEVRWMQFANRGFFDADGNLIEVQSVGRDITERKQAEEVLRTISLYTRSLIEANLDPLVTISPQGKITDVNEAMIQVSGVPRAKLIGSDFSVYFTEPDKARAGYMEVLASGAVRDYPLAIRNQSGKITDVLYNATVYRDESGRVLGVFAAARDITERKRAEEAIKRLNANLQRRKAELEEANTELEAFSYSVSHDLRSPLRGVDAYSKMLLEDHAAQLDEDGRYMLGQVRASAQEMGELIGDLLAFSRMGRREMQMARCDIARIVLDVFRELEEGHPDRRLKLNLKELPACIADPAMIKEVIRNLLGNAVKFTGQREEGLIEVGIVGNAKHSMSDDSAPISVFYVKDNGVGFDPRFTDKLFKIFQRLHRAEEFEGSGIGLALVKRIVDRHGGQVWAEGEIDRGATIYFALPAEAKSNKLETQN